MIRTEDLPWHKIAEYVAEIGSAQSRTQFLAAVLSGLARLVSFDVEGGVFKVTGPSLHVFGTTRGRIAAYSQHYQFLNPLVEKSGSAPWLPEPVTEAEVTDWRGYSHTEFGSDFMLAGNCFKTLSCVFPADPHLIAVHRSRSAPGFNESDRAILTAVTPHVRNLMTIWRKVDGAAVLPDPREVADRFPLLSGREAEIAAFLYGGWTAGEIATRLVISKRTVDSHVEHIYDKLEVKRRSALRDAMARRLGRNPVV